MAKKRSKNKVSQASEPTDTVEPTCTHIRKGLEQGTLKRALPEANWNICQDCQTDNKTKENMDEEVEETPSVWLCLKCGHRGCDRNSQEKHALQHYNTPRSDCHCLVLNLDNWSVWCYLCDDEVPYSSSTQLGQLVDYVRKETNKQTRIQSTKLEQEKKELENKKLEKDSKNEKEKVKNFNKHEENAVPVIDDNAEVIDDNAEVLVKGFSNLGNTCFFNAVMQNLSQTPVLRQLLKEVKMTGTTVTVESLDSPPNEPLVIKLEQQPGPLTSSMCQFLTDVEETKNGIVTPKELFSQVCKKAVRFRGYQQQDSQELLRYLLDGMRAEEIQRVKVGLIASMNDSSENIEDKEEIKRKANEYEKKRAIPNFVDRIFGGELSSTIMCDECQTVSLVHESFLDLSLPVLDEQAVKKGTVPKTFTISEKKVEDEEEEDDDDDDNDSYIKEKTESTGTSKHLQKKAKKQAKKQAKNQRRQNRVIHLSELATVKGDSEENKNSCEEKSQEDPLFEKDIQNQEVEGQIQSAEQDLNLKNMAKEENETDTSIVSAREKNLSQLSERNLTKTEDNLEVLGVSIDNVSGYNSPVLNEGSSPCSDLVSSCLEVCCPPCLENVSPGLEDGNHHLEMDTFHLEAGESVLLEGRTFLGDENPPCLEKFNPCLVEENRDLREDNASCLENVSLHCENGLPCMKEDNQCLTENRSGLETSRQFLGEDSHHLENDSQSLCEKTSPDVKKRSPGVEEDSSRLEEESPCLKEWSPSQGDADTSLNDRDSSLENKSLCIKDLRPSVEKGSYDLEMDCEGMDDIVNDLVNLHLSEAAEPGTTLGDFIDNSPILETKLYEIVNQDPETAFCTLADRKHINTEECSLESCLYQFTRNEKLSETNKLLCNVCTQTQCNKWRSNVKGEKKHVYTNAKKQMLISLTPPILTLHLKRFQQAGINLRKVNRHIKFPELIDLAPFCTVKCKNIAEGDSKVLYSLYGVVEHSGTMRSGHYTAFVKVRRPNTRLSDLVIHRVVPQGLATEPLKGQWYHISDSHVQTVPLTTVLNSQAYLLFYERIL